MYETSQPILPPNPEHAPPYATTYFAKASEDHLFDALLATQNETEQLFGSMSEELGNFSYSIEKWSVKMVLQHIMDCERIFAYRALRFARKDLTVLPGFDDHFYVTTAQPNTRSVSSLLREYLSIRAATFTLFESFIEENLDIVGRSNEHPYSPRSLGWMCAGHNRHHIDVIKERYLPAFTLSLQK
jgi:hypothetical protein